MWMVWSGVVGKENEQSMPAALGPSRLAIKLPAKAMSCVSAKKSPLGQRSHLSVPSSQVWGCAPSMGSALFCNRMKVHVFLLFDM